ncbi:hypothetical protein [Streptomyces chilikensis]|uniref:Uncharacterized protein n=1 Tax=Streptomyces chilikensis TaxID=1194079 RepID=A0ABV3EL83_9ACTN
MFFENRMRVLGAGILAVGAFAIGAPEMAAAQSQTLTGAVRDELRLAPGTTDVVIAAPSGCTARKFTNRRGEATCTSGNGQFRVTITCKRSTGSIYTAQGPWKAPGPNARSTRWCGASSDTITYAGVQKTNG